MSSANWQTELFNGLVTTTGKAVPVASGNITKPNTVNQLSEHMVPTLEVTSNNGRFHGLRDRSRQKFSVHRAMSFLPQE